MLILASTAFALDCGTVSDPNLCAAVNGMTASINTQRGFALVGDAASGAKSSSTIYNQMVVVQDVAIAGGCTVEGWSAGLYTRAGQVVTGLAEDFAGTSNATIDASFAADRSVSGTWDDGSPSTIGDLFGAQNAAFKLAANVGTDGFIAGRYLRENGKRGAFVSLYGTCSTSDAAQVFNDWFGGNVLYSAPSATWPTAARLLMCEPYNANIRTTSNVSPYDEITSGVVTGVTSSGCNGMALDPTDGKVYMIYKAGSTSNRRLGTVDPDTFVVTDVAPLGDKFAGIAIDLNGQMYGVTGDGASEAEVLYELDKLTGAQTPLLTFDDTNDGETIAYRPTDHKIFRAGGISGGRRVQVYDIATGTLTELQTPTMSTNTSEVFGLTWDGVDRFLFTDINSRLGTLVGEFGTPSLEYTDGVVLPDDHRGLVAIP